MKGGWNYRCTGNGVWGGTYKRRCLDVGSARSFASLREAGGAGIYQILWWAVGYNVIAFPLAASVFYPFTLSPEISAQSMSGSQAVVAINALLLKGTKLAGIRRTRAEGTASGKAVSGEPAYNS